MGKLDYHERKENRIAKYEELSDKNKKASKQAYEASHEEVKHIPMGQPILVGHHSEGAHRNALEKSWNKMGKSVKLQEKADYYKEKAQAAENNTAISSDDPDALEKLNEKLTNLVEYQNMMKAINRICRSKKLSEEEMKEKIKTEYGLEDGTIHKLLNPTYSYERKGFEHYSLTNNNAKIKNTKIRIKKLEQLAQLENKSMKYGEVEVLINADDNRVEIHFPGKPDETFRKKLKSNGFRWSRYKSAWQKYISRWNIMDAQKLAKEFSEL